MRSASLSPDEDLARIAGLSPAILQGQHLPEIRDIGRRFVGRQVRAREALRFGQTSLQTYDQGKVRAHPRIDPWLAGRASQRCLRAHEVLGKRIGETKIGQDRRFIRRDPQRGAVVALRFLMSAHLVERRTLNREDAPVRLPRRVGTVEHVDRLPVMPEIGKSAAIRAEHALVLGVLNRGLLEHGERLGALAVPAQRLRIVDGSFRITGIGTETFAPGERRAPPIAASIPWRGDAERTGCLGWLRRHATHERERQPSRKHDWNDAAKRIKPLGSDRTSHHSPIGPPPRLRQ